MRRRLVLLLALALLLSGCLSVFQDPASTADEADGDVEPAGNGGDDSPDGNGEAGNGNGGNGNGNATREEDDNRTREDDDAPGGGDGNGSGARSWPPLEDATIRPGVRLTMPDGTCTANFVFTSPDGRDVFIGTAAHCVEGMSANGTVTIAGDAARGRVAYDSFATMDAVNEGSGTVRDWNDFALIEIPRDAHHLVHPASLHYGGPTGIADGASAGERVLTYGNTPYRMGVYEANAREGYVMSSSDWGAWVYTVTPGVPGDSGSAVLLGDGKALGVLATVQIAPFTGQNGIVNLAKAIEYAREHAGVHVELATWDQLDGGVLPDLA